MRATTIMSYSAWVSLGITGTAIFASNKFYDKYGLTFSAICLVFAVLYAVGDIIACTISKRKRIKQEAKGDNNIQIGIIEVKHD